MRDVRLRLFDTSNLVYISFRQFGTIQILGKKGKDIHLSWISLLPARAGYRHHLPFSSHSI